MSNTVEKINELAAKLDGTRDDQQILVDIEYYCRHHQREIDREFSSYFVSVNEYGTDDDFVRCYTPLGFITQEEARRCCEKLSDESYLNDQIMAVDEETFDQYVLWSNWDRVLRILKSLKRLDADIPWYDDVEAKVSSVKEALGRKFRWEYPGTYNIG